MGHVLAADLSQIAGDLLERDEALSALGDSLLPVQQSSQGRVVLVSGEAGVGKTSLLRRFCDACRPSARILWGACEPLLTPSPLAPFAEFAPSCARNFQELLERATTPHEISLGLVRELRRKVGACAGTRKRGCGASSAMRSSSTPGSRSSGDKALLLRRRFS